jgi:hypothetical protein
MRYELSDYEWTAIKPMLPNKPRPSRPQWHLLGFALKRGMPRLASDLWSPHYLLQSLRSVAAGWRLGPDRGCTCCRS